GLKISGNSTAAIAPGTAAKYTQGWAAHAGAKQGDAAVTEDSTNSRLTLARGIYHVVANITVETEDPSGTSGDDNGTIAFKLYKGGSEVSGALAKVNMQDLDRPQTVCIDEVVE